MRPLNQRKFALLGFLLTLAIFALYWRATTDGFVNYDDPQYLTSNAHVQKGLSWTGIRWAFTTGEAANWHPLTWLSHMLDCQLYGLNPWGHHLTSLLFHAANVLLGFLVLNRLTRAPWRSFAVALLFGVHPLRVESVAWVSERKDVVSGFFFMLTLLAYVKYVSEKIEVRNPKSEANSKSLNSKYSAFRIPHSAFAYAIALLFFALGLMSKPMLVTVPFVLLLLDFWPLGRWNREGKKSRTRILAGLVLEKLPFLALAAISSIITFTVQQHGGAVKTMSALPIGLRIENTAISYCRYILKTIWPIDLSVFYPFPDHWPASSVMASTLILIGLTVAAISMVRTRPYFFVGWFWFVGTLIPVIGLIQVGDQSLADHYTYIPSLGLLIALVWGASEAIARWNVHRAVRATFGTAAICLCAGLTWQQIGYWKDSETLFRHALAINPNNSVAHSNLAWALTQKGREDEALAHYEAAVLLTPHDATERCNYATTLMVKERLDEAIAEFRKGVETDPGDPRIRLNFGSALLRKGRTEDAIVQFQKAAEIAPERSEMQRSLADALGKAGRFEEAATHLQKALALDPNYPGIHFKLAMTLVQLNRLKEAVASFQAAANQQPDDANLHYFYGGALVEVQRVDEAIEQFQQALSIEPNLAAAHLDIARAYEMKGRTEDAISHLTTVLKLQPENPEAYNAFGATLANVGRIAEAEAQFQEALRLKPDFSDARVNLSKIQSLKRFSSE